MSYVAATRSSPPDTANHDQPPEVDEHISVAGHTGTVREIIPGVGRTARPQPPAAGRAASQRPSRLWV